MKNIISRILDLGHFRILLIFCLLDIIFFVNFNSPLNKYEFKLAFYTHVYIIVLCFVPYAWGKYKDTLTRSLLIALSFYWTFEIIAQIIAVTNLELYKELYKGKIINYVLALSCGGSLAILPLIKKIKK